MTDNLSPSDDRFRQILRALEGTASPEDRADLEQWRSASVENDRFFRELASIWHEGGDADALSGIDWDAVAHARPRAEELLGRTGGGPRPRRMLPVRRWLHRGIAVGAAALVGFFLSESTRTGSALYPQEFVTGPNELATASLSDGTVVRLAPGSRLRIADPRSGREVWLHGQAFFSVPPRQSERFVVHTAVGRAVVLGTRFEVETRGDDFRVAVLEGAVEVVSQDGRVEARQGHVAHMARGVPPTVVEVADVPGLFRWLGSFLAFQNTPLHQVAREIESSYGVRVDITDPSLEDRVVTGWFSEREVMEVIGVVCRVIGAHCVLSDSVVVVSPRGSAGGADPLRSDVPR